MLCAHGTGVSAQTAQDGPVIVGQRKEYDTFNFDHFHASLELWGRYQRDEQKSGGKKTVDMQTLYRETLELDTEGFVLAPNFITLDLNARFRLEQFEFDGDDQSQSSRTFQALISYDASATLLPRGKLPATLYSQRSQSFQNRTFGAALENVVFENGIRLAYRSDFAPMNLTIFRREIDQEDTTGQGGFRQLQDSFSGHGQILPRDGHRFAWDYTYDSFDQSGDLRQSDSFDRHDANVVYEYTFGENRQSSALSTVHLISEQGGQRPLTRLRLSENIRLRHSKKLESRYRYTFNQQDLSDSDQISHFASALVRHELYESLVSTATVGGTLLEERVESFDSEEFFAEGTLEYTKKVPLGTFDANARLRFAFEDQSDRGSGFTIVNEPNTFGPAGTITLDRQNIISSSLFITNIAGIIIYSQGTDYTVQEFPDRIEVRLVLGGNISLGQTVLVSYQIGPDPANTTQTTSYGLTFRYTFQEGFLTGLSPWIRYADQHQTRESDSLLALPESDFTDLTLGLDYIRQGLTLRATYRDRDSSLSPFTSTTFEGRYLQRFSRRSSILLSTQYQEINNTDQGSRTSTATLSGRWNQQINENLRISLALILRDQRNSTGSDSLGIEEHLDINWSRGQTTVFANLRNAQVDSDVSDTSFQSIVVGFRRDF